MAPDVPRPPLTVPEVSSPPSPSRARSRTATALVVLGSVTLTIALIAGWAQRTVFDPDEFADRAVVVLESASVRHACPRSSSPTS